MLVLPSSLSLTLSFFHHLILLLLFSHSAPNMVDVFVGTWNLKESKNFDDYMKALGECDVDVRCVCALQLMWGVPFDASKHM